MGRENTEREGEAQIENLRTKYEIEMDQLKKRPEEEKKKCKWIKSNVNWTMELENEKT